MIKLPLLKKLRIPKDILFPDDQIIEQIKTLNHKIAKKKLQHRVDNGILDGLYAKLDDMIEPLIL